jgi:predicted PurR-regulated permease PerM
LSANAHELIANEAQYPLGKALKFVDDCKKQQNKGCMQLSPSQLQSLSWAGLSLVLAAILWLLGPVLTPFVVAAVLAYALAPLVNKLAARKVPRVLAVVLVELVFLAVLLGVLLLIVPIVIKELPLLREQIPVLAERLSAAVQPLLAQLGITAKLDVASIKALVLKYLSANAEDWVAQALASLKVGGSVALTVLGNAVLIPVALFYLLLDWQGLVARAQAFIPPRFKAKVGGFFEETDSVLGQYLRGQLLVMLILAVYYAIGLALFGLDLALPIGLFTGLAMFIPYLGFGLGLILALLAAVLQFSLAKAALMVAVVYGSGQIIESLFLTPRLVGERIGLHPLAVIFALLAFGQLFGFVGVLVALPASAVLLVALRRAKASYLASDLFRGMSQK